MLIATLKNTKAKNVDLQEYFAKNSLQIDPLEYFDITGKNGWFLGSKAEFKLKQKIEQNGKPLKDWDVKINYGIKTGLNEAFIIDENKKNELIAKDPKSAEIIKPILRGRDIKRYGYEFANLYVIATFPALHLNIDDYPAVRDYLLDFGKDRLEQAGKTLANGTKSRKKTGNKWFETQDQIGYFAEFEKEKVVYSEIVREPQFYLDKSGDFFAEATTFLMTGENMKFFCGLLNSKPFTYFFKNYYAGGGLGETGYRYKKVFLENVPIPILNTPEKQQIAGQIELLVEEILAVKNGESKEQKDTANLESQIDEMVFGLYGLDAREVRVILG
jgi:adenine-specific DNA-methyltransferase